MIQVRQVVLLLVLLQFVATLYLWTLTPVGMVSEGRFAIFLATDLLTFALVSYVYTHTRWGEVLSRGWILAGTVGLILLLLSALYV